MHACNQTRNSCHPSTTTHLDGLDQRAEQRNVVLDRVAVDDIPEQYGRVDTLVHLQCRQTHSDARLLGRLQVW